MMKRRRQSSNVGTIDSCYRNRNQSNSVAASTTMAISVLLAVAIGSSMMTETDAFSTCALYSLKPSLSNQKYQMSTPSLSFSRQHHQLGAVALEQSNEDTASSSSILSVGKSKDWIRWEQDLVQLGRQGRTDEALDLFDSLMESMVKSLSPQEQQMHLQLPPLSTRVRWWNAALDACARARPTRCDDALALFQRGLQLKLPMLSYADGEGESLPLLQPNVFTFGILTSACARARRADLALDLLRHMEVRTESITVETKWW